MCENVMLLVSFYVCADAAMVDFITLQNKVHHPRLEQLLRACIRVCTCADTTIVPVSLCVCPKLTMFSVFMMCFSDLISLQEALKLDDECYVLEFEVHKTVHIQSALSSNASIYGLGGFVRRTSKEVVKCKVVSTLENFKNFESFVLELRTYGHNLVCRLGPATSADEKDIDLAFSKRFEVHHVASPHLDTKNPSPDTKSNGPWENVSVVSSCSGGNSVVSSCSGGDRS
jgi:hypothetical protein